MSHDEVIERLAQPRVPAGARWASPRPVLVSCDPPQGIPSTDPRPRTEFSTIAASQFREYATHAARGRHQAKLDDLIQNWTKRHSVDEIEDIMIQNSVPVGKIYRAAEMVDDPHFAARQAIIDAPSERWGEVKMQSVTPKLSATPGQVRWAGPDTLGAHTDEVFQQLLGLTAAEISALKKKSIT